MQVRWGDEDEENEVMSRSEAFSLLKCCWFLNPRTCAFITPARTLISNNEKHTITHLSHASSHTESHKGNTQGNAFKPRTLSSMRDTNKHTLYPWFAVWWPPTGTWVKQRTSSPSFLALYPFPPPPPPQSGIVSSTRRMEREAEKDSRTGALDGHMANKGKRDGESKFFLLAGRGEDTARPSSCHLSPLLLLLPSLCVGSTVKLSCLLPFFFFPASLTFPFLFFQGFHLILHSALSHSRSFFNFTFFAFFLFLYFFQLRGRWP